MRRLYSSIGAVCALQPPLLAAAAVAGALLPVAPVAAQQDWRALASHERQIVDSELPGWHDWTSWRVELRRYWTGGNLAVEGIRSRRFEITDNAVAVDGYLNVTARTYVRGSVRFAPDAGVMAEQDHRLEVFHSTPGDWETSAGYRYMDFSPEKVHLFSASLARYLPGWYLRAAASLNPSFDENAVFVGANIRRFLESVDGHVELATGAGEEVVEVAAGPAVDIRDSRFASLRAELFPAFWGVAGELSYHGVSDLPGRMGIGATLMVRW